MTTLYRALSLAIFLSACSFTPKYERPTVPLSDSWINVALGNQDKSAKTPTELGWRDFFYDKQLQQLITTALTYNHDLRNAALNVEKTAAQYLIQNNKQIPTIAGTASATRDRISGAVSPLGKSRTSNNYTIGLGLNHFELDFFGRMHALSDAALNNYLRTNEARDAAQLSIIRAVAQAYYAMRINQVQVELAEKILKSRQKSVQIAQAQLESGIINANIVYGYKAAIELARANAEIYQRNYQQARNNLSVLLGVPYEQLDLKPVRSLDEQLANLRLPSRIPSQVLQVRPDIRQAEYALISANANIGAARAALYPSISLTGNVGYLSAELNDLIKKPHLFGSIGPSLTLPIFNRSVLNAQVKVSEIEQQQAVENYQAVVQNAFREVADALVAYQTYNEQYAASKRAVAAQNMLQRIEYLRFKSGINTSMDLINAERDSYSAQENLYNVELALLQSKVTLYIAMGGGLYEDSSSRPAPAYYKH